MSFDLPALPNGWAFLPLDRCAVPGSISYGVVQPGSPAADDDEGFATKMQALTEKLDALIRQKLGGLGYEF